MSSSRKPYLDNIRWATVVLVVIYHVIYMFNGVQPFGVIGPFREHQFQDGFLYLVYPWFMALLFVVSGMSARYCLQSHTTKQFLKDKTRKLLVPSTIGLFVFQWILGLYNVKIGGGVDFSAIPKPVLYLIAVLSGVGPLWYIQMLWLFSVLLLAVRKMEKDRFWNFCSKAPVWSIALLVIVVYGSAQVLNTPSLRYIGSASTGSASSPGISCSPTMKSWSGCASGGGCLIWRRLYLASRTPCAIWARTTPLRPC